jgi:flagellar hook-length control protein FliK
LDVLAANTAAAPAIAPTLIVKDEPVIAPTHGSDGGIANALGQGQQPTHAETRITAHAGTAGHALGIAIARCKRDGQELLSVQLDPVEFGRVDVRIAFSDQGEVNAVISAEQPAALALLRRDTVDLVRALNQAGIGADAGAFRFEQRGNGQDRPAGRIARGKSFPVSETNAVAIRLSGNRLDLLA